MRLSRTKTSPRYRPGFSLIELLVVIAIIAVLAGLLTAGIFSWISTQQRKNTEANMRSINKLFQEQWSWVIDQSRKETPSANVVSVANINGSDPTGERARVLWTKIRLIEAFPISYGEINDPSNPVFVTLYGPGAAIPANQQKYLVAYQLASQHRLAATIPATESGACLLMALSVSRGGSVLSPDLLGNASADTDGDGVLELVDGWRTALTFYRFAWGSAPLPGPAGSPPWQGGINGSQGRAPVGLNPAPFKSKSFQLADPLDPGGLLLTWPANPARVAFETFAHQIAPGPQPPTNYVIPVIVSSGPDGQLGLPLPANLTAAGLTPTPAITVPNAAVLDDVFSFNLKGN